MSVLLVEVTDAVRFRFRELNWPPKCYEVEGHFRRPIRRKSCLNVRRFACKSPLFASVRKLLQLVRTPVSRTVNSRLMRGTIPPPILKPQLLSVGAFSCLFAPVPACCWGFLRTSPAARLGRFRPHSTLSWPFLAPTSLPETGPKSAKAATQPNTDQRVTRGRIERLDCSIGWRRKRGGCVPSVVIDPYRHIATRMECTWMADGRDRLSGHRPDNYNRASKISPEGHHEHPESFQDRTH